MSSNFATAMVVSRHFKVDLDEAGNPRRLGAKAFKPEQVILETEDAIYVSRFQIAQGAALPRLVSVDPSWSLMEEFTTRMTVRGKNEVPARGVAAYAPIDSADLDRALQVACDMGRWDIAYMMVLRVWDLGELAPASVLWDYFPHASAMSVVSGGRLFVPGGLAKTVLERWWAWQGGYHCNRPLLWTDWTEYDAVMDGLRNPFALAGVDPRAVRERVAAEVRPAGLIPAALAPEDLRKRTWYWGAGVAYLANAKGEVLPYWFASESKGAKGTMESLAWGPDVRNKIARQMNLPILIARKSSAG